MYNVLIVDDEKNIRLGIQAMIAREFSDVVETTVASDGLDALEKIEDQKVDILITDIKMPRMDGIKLIQHLHEKEQKPALIILSGYDDFEYTKAAIKCNVKDYLLKPVNRNELFQTIQNTIDGLQSDRLVTHQHIDDFRTSQLNYILLNPNLDKAQIEEICLKIQLDVYFEGFFVAVVDHDRNIEGEVFFHHVKEHISKSSIDTKMNSFCFLDKDNRTIVITDKEHLFLQLKDKLGNEKYISYSISVSEMKNEIKAIKEAYEEATFTAKYHFLFPRNPLLFYKDIKNKQQHTNLPRDTMNKILNMLGTDREKEIKVLLKNVLDFDEISNYDIRYMEAISHELSHLMAEMFASKIGEESETVELIKKIGNIYCYVDFYAYFHGVEVLLMRLHEYLKQVKSVYSEQKYMDKAIQFIEENFQKDLNLAVVSNYTSLNYSYFSHMFKEYTGQNFVDYLKEVRITQAKKLLMETDDKVLEISEQVGYKNPKQFARVFREIVGVSPKEYREKM